MIRSNLTLKGLAAAIAVALPAVAPAPALAEPVVTPCFEVFVLGLDCGNLEVPLDRGGVNPGTVRLQIFRLRATQGPRRGTLVMLAGGPGQASSTIMPLLPEILGGSARYDLVAVDQRGTGLSEVLRCDRLEKVASQVDDKFQKAVASCAADLGPGRANYNTAESVEDLEAARVALGVDRLTLFGVSYGTKLALAYAQRYPDKVDRMLLDSVLPINRPDTFLLDTPAPLRRILTEICAAAPDCGRIVGDPVAALARTVARLNRAPLTGTVYGADGESRESSMDTTDLFDTVTMGDLNPFVYEQLIGAIQNARRGDPAPLLRLAAPEESVSERFDHEGDDEVLELSPAMNVATLCADAALPWTRGTDPAGRRPAIDAAAAAIPDSLFAPFDRATYVKLSLASYCQNWPDGAAPSPLATGPLPSVPTLVLNGEVDLRTPVEGMRAALASNPAAQIVTLPNVGHSTVTTDPSGCSLKLAKQFLLQDSSAPRCGRMADPIAVRRPPPLRLREVAALRGSCRPSNTRRRKRTRRAGCDTVKRTVGAAYLTFRDVVEQWAAGVESSGGGLRGGGWSGETDEFDEDEELVDAPEISLNLRLSSVEYLPGLIVSGRVSGPFPRLSGTLDLYDAAGHAGSIRIRGVVRYARGEDRIRFTGRFGGRAVSLTTPLARDAGARGRSHGGPRGWRRGRSMGWLVRTPGGWAGGPRRPHAQLKRARSSR